MLLKFVDRIVSCALLVSLWIATPVNGYLAGVKNALDISVLEQAKDVYFDEIAKLINNV